MDCCTTTSCSYFCILLDVCSHICFFVSLYYHCFVDLVLVSQTEFFQAVVKLVIMIM